MPTNIMIADEDGNKAKAVKEENAIRAKFTKKTMYKD